MGFLKFPKNNVYISNISLFVLLFTNIPLKTYFINFPSKKCCGNTKISELFLIGSLGGPFITQRARKSRQGNQNFRRGLGREMGSRCEWVCKYIITREFITIY